MTACSFAVLAHVCWNWAVRAARNAIPLFILGRTLSTCRSLDMRRLGSIRRPWSERSGIAPFLLGGRFGTDEIIPSIGRARRIKAQLSTAPLCWRPVQPALFGGYFVCPATLFRL